MPVTRRNLLLTGLAGLGSIASLPAWAQAIGSQSDPWAQVDPYDDPRNGFPSQRAGGGQAQRQGLNRDVFSSPADSGERMSDADEIRLGRQGYSGRISKGGGAYPDARVQQALRDFFAPMTAVADRSQLPWQITLVNEESPNASAGYGGMVIVHAGLLRICDRPGELAATLAHEIGHVDKYHMARMGPIYELLGKLKAEGGKADLGGNLDTLLQTPGAVDDIWDVFRLSYTREHETEADAHEMVILERLGVDPIHAINDQWNFAQINGGAAAVNELVLSHPYDENRMAHIKQLAAMQKRPAKDYVFPGWDVLKAAFPTAPRFKKA